MHSHFFRRQLSDFRDHALRPLRTLRWHPGLRAVRTNMHGAIHRLHANVRCEGQLIDGFDFLGRSGECRIGVAVIAKRVFGRLGGILQELLTEFFARFARGRAFVHFTSKALRPWMAAQELSARTATPPVVEAPRPLVLISKTSRTPGTAFALAASKEATLPSKTGQRAITA